MKILIVCDSLVTDVASGLFFSQIYISGSFLKCLCQRTLVKSLKAFLAYLRMLLLYKRKARFLQKTLTCWLRVVSRHYHTTFWGPPSLTRLQGTPPHTQFTAPTALDNDTSASCSHIRGIKKCLILDLKYRSLGSTFCAEVWTGAWWRISVWQTALELLCCTLALCQSDRETFHIPVREKSAL